MKTFLQDLRLISHIVVKIGFVSLYVWGGGANHFLRCPISGFLLEIVVHIKKFFLYILGTPLWQFPDSDDITLGITSIHL